MTMAAGSLTSLWQKVEELVPPELPPDVAVARLVALARSLLIENRQLREALELARGQSTIRLDALRPPRDTDVEAA